MKRSPACAHSRSARWRAGCRRTKKHAKPAQMMRAKMKPHRPAPIKVVQLPTVVPVATVASKKTWREWLREKWRDTKWFRLIPTLEPSS